MKGKKLSDGKVISGRGRLTDNLIDSMQNWYGDAIRQNKGNLDGMTKAVQAILYHKVSTDCKPQHQFCPHGSKSWCGYQRDLASGTSVYKHHDSLPQSIFKVVRPIFQSLAKPVIDPLPARTDAEPKSSF